jgi:predicted translin family RNA/ssDNA-binding protein
MGVLAELQDIKKELRKQHLANLRVMNIEQVSEYFEIPIKTIYNNIRKIPHSKKSGLWFKKVDFEEWLLSNPITTEAELDRKASSYLLKNRR